MTKERKSLSFRKITPPAVGVSLAVGAKPAPPHDDGLRRKARRYLRDPAGAIMDRLRDVELQQTVHSMETHIIQERSDKAAEDAGDHAPGAHLQIGDAHHEADAFRRLPFARRGEQEVAGHIEQASDDADEQKPF